MNLLYFSFFIFCFVTLGQLAGYFVLVNQIPDDAEMNDIRKQELKEKANSYILPYYSVNLVLIVILFICKSMNSTKWWFMFWTILLGLFPAGLALYIIIKYDDIKDELKEICNCKVKLERDPDTGDPIKCPTDKQYNNKDVEKYCDKLTLGLLLVSIFQLIAFTFYFISLYHNHDFRKIQPDVIYIQQPTEPVINTTTNSPQNNRMNNSQKK